MRRIYLWACSKQWQADLSKTQLKSLKFVLDNLFTEFDTQYSWLCACLYRPITIYVTSLYTVIYNLNCSEQLVKYTGKTLDYSLFPSFFDSFHVNGLLSRACGERRATSQQAKWPRVRGFAMRCAQQSTLRIAGEQSQFT